MRVLLVNNYARVTGGVDRLCFDLADALRDRGHEVRFLGTDRDPELHLEGAFPAAPVTHHSREALNLTAQASVAAQAIWNRTAAAAMRRLLNDFAPHVVYAHKLYPQLSVAPIAVASRAGVPIVQAVNDYEFISASPEDQHGGPIDRQDSRASYRALNTTMFLVRRLVHARAVCRWVAASHYVVDAHAAQGIDCDLIEYFVPTALSTTNGPDYSERSGALFSGRLVETKGVRDVLALARRLPQLPVTVAGTGPLSDLVRTESRELPNLELVEFFGDRDRVLELARQARVVLVPSRWAEPGGLVALEAMAVGTPVVAYEQGGLAEYVSGSGAGVVVSTDSAALSDAAASICGDPGRWAGLSARGRHAIRETHSAEHHVERLERVFAAAIAGSR